MHQGYQVYEKSHVTTADKGRILLMLYQGSIDFIREAECRMQEGDDVKARVLQGKAFQIVAELMNTLDYEKGGDIATNLRRIYAFILQHLSEGNRRKDGKQFNDVIHLLTVLNDAFTQALVIISRPTGTKSECMRLAQ